MTEILSKLTKIMCQPASKANVMVPFPKGGLREKEIPKKHPLKYEDVGLVRDVLKTSGHSYTITPCAEGDQFLNLIPHVHGVVFVASSFLWSEGLLLQRLGIALGSGKKVFVLAVLDKLYPVFQRRLKEHPEQMVLEVVEDRSDQSLIFIPAIVSWAASIPVPVASAV